uniref:OVATE domain-containing protein n=1 Tax=Arundo donax TaxID=35708 RepID=A0A0A9GY28_ARUDO
MLGWYLRANGKSTHGLIVGAFVDLLVALSTASPADSSPATPTICSSSSACSSL